MNFFSIFSFHIFIAKIFSKYERNLHVYLSCTIIILLRLVSQISSHLLVQQSILVHNVLQSEFRYLYSECIILIRVHYMFSDFFF
jgi:hypothetical protein